MQDPPFKRELLIVQIILWFCWFWKVIFLNMTLAVKNIDLNDWHLLPAFITKKVNYFYYVFMPFSVKRCLDLDSPWSSMLPLRHGWLMTLQCSLLNLGSCYCWLLFMMGGWRCFVFTSSLIGDKILSLCIYFVLPNQSLHSICIFWLSHGYPFNFSILQSCSEAWTYEVKSFSTYFGLPH